MRIFAASNMSWYVNDVRAYALDHSSPDQAHLERPLVSRLPVHGTDYIVQVSANLVELIGTGRYNIRVLHKVFSFQSGTQLRNLTRHGNLYLFCKSKFCCPSFDTMFEVFLPVLKEVP